MFYRWMAGLCLCLSYLLTSLLRAEGETNSPLPSISSLEVEYFQLLVQGNNRFAFDLYQEVRQQTGNLCFSPYSILSGLAVAAIGAKGDTAIQFQRIFRYSLHLLPLFRDLNEFLQPSSSKNKNGSQIWVADRLWIQKNIPILPSFQQTLLRSLNETIESTDFINDKSRSISMINQWTSQETERKINNVLNTQDVTTKTRLLLTTAITMKGQWEDPFDSRQTIREPFYVTSQRSLLSNMMQKTLNCLVWKGDQWDLVVLPYKQTEEKARLVMVIILPKQETSLEELEKNLTWDHWQQWLSQVQMESVTLTLPRFRIEKRLDLGRDLQALGLVAPFSAEANFSGITQEKDLFLEKAIHKTLIRVEELGTEGARIASPQKSPNETPNESPPYPFIANRPFVFIVWEKQTNSVVWMGRLAFP